MGRYLETPDLLSNVLSRFVPTDGSTSSAVLRGSTPDISSPGKLAGQGKAQSRGTSQRSFLSGVDYLELRMTLQAPVVGERTMS